MSNRTLFRTIAAHLRTEAPKYPTEIDYGTSDVVATFTFGTLKVMCPAYQERILSVAAKYERGYRKPHSVNARLTKPTLRRPPDADALLAALESELGELDIGVAA
jgi:hypothetical protein